MPAPASGVTCSQASMTSAVTVSIVQSSSASDRAAHFWAMPALTRAASSARAVARPT